MSPEKDAAIKLLAKLVELSPQFDLLNTQMKPLFGDMAPQFTPVADSVEGDVMALIDAVLGDGLGTYFLYDCQPRPHRSAAWSGGQIHEPDGSIWPIRTIADLRAYVDRQQ